MTVKASGFRVSGFGYWVSGFRFRVLGFGVKVQDVVMVQGVGCWGSGEQRVPFSARAAKASADDLNIRGEG